MGSIIHDEVEIEDFEYDEETETYYYPCPCGDRFEVTLDELLAGEEIATCPSCSLIVKVVYDIDVLKAQQDQEELEEKLTNLSLEVN